MPVMKASVLAHGLGRLDPGQETASFPVFFAGPSRIFGQLARLTQVRTWRLRKCHHAGPELEGQPAAPVLRLRAVRQLGNGLFEVPLIRRLQ
ncbi:MAG: hypothetical protein WCD66_06260 [Rhodanobacteraceae bacterium]